MEHAAMTTEERSAALMRVYHFADSKLKETLKNPELTLKLLALAREVQSPPPPIQNRIYSHLN